MSDSTSRTGVSDTVDTDRCPSGHPDRPTVHRINGWAPPTWAKDAGDQCDHAIFWQLGSDTPTWFIDTVDGDNTVTRLHPVLTRIDDIAVDLAAGAIKIRQGATLIHVGDDLDFTTDQARRLAGVLLELADAAEAGR